MAASFGATTASGEFLAPFVPSPEPLVERMLDVARVGPGDTVYDLGAGDGRIVVAAAQRFGAQAVGVELDDERFALSSARIRNLGLEPRARIIHADLRGIDLRPATVVTLYQFTAVNEMLRPTLEHQLRSGARVVTLDFPVPGWEAESVVTGRLTDGSQHAIYLYSMNAARKGTAIMALSERYFEAMRYSLELQGASAGFVEYVEGGDAFADVVTLMPGPDRIQRKHLANLRYQDITLRVDAGTSSSVYDWIDTTLRQPYARRNGTVVIADFDNNEVSRLNFNDAIISEIGFPALDAGSKTSAHITLKLTPDRAARAPGSGRKLTVPGGQKAKWTQSNFRLQIDGLDCSRVSRIDALTIASIQAPSDLGERRDYQKTPEYLAIPNLSLTLSEYKSDSFREWHEDFVIRGNNGADTEKNGRLEYLAPNLKDVLFTLTFRHLGIFRLTPEKADAGNERIGRLRAEMYCEEIEFNYGAGVASGQSAGAGTAAGSAAAGGAAAGDAAAGGAPAGGWGEDKVKYADSAAAAGAAGGRRDDKYAGGSPASAKDATWATKEGAAADGKAADAWSEDKYAGAAVSAKGADAGSGQGRTTNATRWKAAGLSTDVVAPLRVGRQLKFRS